MDIQLKKAPLPNKPQNDYNNRHCRRSGYSRRYCGATRRSVGNESGEGVAAHRRRDARSV